MTTTPADIRLEEGGFNNLTPRDTILTFLESILEEGAEYVDVQGIGYWVNKSDTLVLAVDKSNTELGLKLGLKLGRFAAQTQADEFDFMNVGSKKVVRFWWD